MRAKLLPLLLGAWAAACGRGEPGRAGPGSRTDSAVTVDPATVHGRTAVELWQLRPDVSLGSWMQAHLDERLERRDSASTWDFAGDWCARAERRMEVEGHALVRQAFFYPPEAPTPPVIPESPDPETTLMRECGLGMIWMSVPERDSAGGDRLADSVRSALQRAFGGPRDSTVSFWGSAFWRRVGRVRRGDVTAVSAVSGMVQRWEAGGGRSPREILAFAYLPRSGLSVDTGLGSSSGRDWAPDTLPLDTAIAAARLDTTRTAPLLRVLAAATAWRPRDAPDGGMLDPAPFADALGRWLAAAAALPPPRRAAALYVADEVMERAACAYLLCGRAGPADSTRLVPFQALGARFTYTPLGASWVFNRNWLSPARALDRDGSVGRAILLLQLEHQFDFSGICAGGLEGFRRVMAEGERYLARVPNGPISAEVHFLVGDAYRDVVALASGVLAEYVDSVAPYRNEAPGARARALEHYRATMALAPERPVARAAWRRAWWILAGLPPRETRFVCVYD